MIWARMLAYITGTVDQELLLRNEYLAAENRILKAQIKGRLLLSDAEKGTLAEIAHRLGRKAWKNWRPRQVGYHAGLVPKADRQQVRRIEVPRSPDVPELTRKPSVWWCRWRRKIPGGAMTGSWAPWPI